MAQSALWSATGSDFILKAASGNDLVIAGYASVDMVDKQGDRIPVSALKKAFQGFMDNAAYRNVQLAHSGIQVGEVLTSYTDQEGRVWKSTVDDHGLFVVCKIRNDIEKAREVQKQVRSGELRAFSIGGQALFRVSKTTEEHGTHREITDMELHEITLCKKGINPESTYTLLKMDDDTMSEQSETLTEIRDALSRINKHMETDEAPAVEQAPAPVAKTEEQAIAYIDSLEKFAHEQGVDLDGLRGHFGLGKAYMVGVDGQHGFNHRGQGDLIGSGEDATLASAPSLPNAKSNKYVIKQPQVPQMKNAAPQGNRQVIKQGLDLTPQSLERGYQAYSGIRDEEAVKSLVEKEWNNRYDSETQQALEVQKANDFGSQIASLQAEITNLRTENVEIQKSAVPVPAQSDIRVPTHEEFAALGNGIDGWRALEELGQRAMHGSVQ
jgi:HK97 family phage prohead protease|tara:strand:+ start:13453 stop:14769 length:1317 start_codon:yes stop_codon:yes gene_type:complete